MEPKNADSSAINHINGIRFTSREIDIISCIISGRSVKSISTFLDISAKTTDFHIRNIMTKFGCNSKDSIARISEKSGEYNFLTKHYQNIYKRILLNELIQKIKLLNKAKRILVVHNLSETDISHKLTELLRQCEIIVEREQSDQNEAYISINSTKLLPNEKDDEISLFCKVIRSFCKDSDALVLIEKLENKPEIKTTENNGATKKLSLQKKILISLFVTMFISGFGIKFYFDRKDSVVSNLYYASSNVIERASLLQQIDKAIKENKNEVKVIVLSGSGGAGKTTIARNFLKDNSVQIKWEINAESKETIIDSFYDLAIVIANKQNKQEALDSIKSIPNPEERTKRIMLFVQACLKQNGNWCLFFDNVDNMDLVKEYFPINSEIWGRGLALITTRNKNIGNSVLFSSIVVHVGELNPEEQYKLFCGILYDGYKNVSHEQSVSIMEFLSKIPMLPLDVSSAAYYIKNTKIKFEDYLSYIHSLREDFENMHKKIISEYMEYNDTRNGIIISIFNKIIQANPAFKELLLFMCMVDSQNIPMKFFEDYKGKIIAQEFNHALKRFSVIIERDDAFSIHRSTQEIGLKYILSLISEDEKNRFLDQIVKIMTPYGGMLPNRYDEQERYLTKLEQKTIAQHARFFIKHIEDIGSSKKDEYKAKLLLSILYSHRTNDNFAESMIPIADQISEINKDGLYIQGYDFAVLQLESIYYHFCVKDYSEGEKRLEKVMALCDEIKSENLKIIAAVYFAQLYCENDNFEKCQKYLDLAEDLLSKCEGSMAAIASTVLSTRYQICYLYHYICGEKLKVAVASFEDSLKRLHGSTFFYKNPDEYKKLNRIQNYMIPNARKRLANVYNHLEMYDQARECEKEAIFFYEKEETFNPIGLLVKIDEGYTLLRTNDVSEAREVLSKTIEIKEKLGSSQDMLEAYLWISEANIRLNKFIEAYDNCIKALKLTKKSKTNFAKLLKVLCYYNMSIAKYKLSDKEKSIEHFKAFFELSNEFCKGFLEKTVYEKLFSDNAFEIPKEESQVKICLQNALKIFSAIYGENHSFVKNYVSKID